MFIVIYGGPDHENRFVLKPGDTRVGRGETCDLRVNESSMSRWHATFSVTGDRCVLADAGSRNGTYLNGVQIITADIKDGDRVFWGEASARIEVSAEDQLAIVEKPSASPFPFTLDRPVDQPSAPHPAVDAGRLLTLISDMAQSLVKTQPLSNILEEVVRLGLETMHAERAFLILKDEKTGTLVPRVARTRLGEAAKGAVSRTVLNRVVTDRVAVLASNAQNDERFDASQTRALRNIGSFMCAPLWSQNDTIGAIYLDTSITEEFVPADLELLVALSNYAAVAIEQARLADRLTEETRRGERLGRYHSPAVVARILHDGADADSPLLAQEREVSVLFADLVGFTAMSEHMPPQEVAAMLNTCFARMTDVVFEYEGTLDKFIGDCLLAVFGAPLDQPDHAVRAVRTAQAIARTMAQLNEETGGPPLELRMAVNSGIALAGDIGSPRRREYTVLGDVVNTASRLETTVAEPGQIVVSRATYDRITPEIQARSLGLFTLRGKREPIEVFEVDA